MGGCRGRRFPRVSAGRYRGGGNVGVGRGRGDRSRNGDKIMSRSKSKSRIVAGGALEQRAGPARSASSGG